MSLSPHTEKLSNGKVRLWFTPDLSGQGYRFYLDGVAVTRTFDKSIDHMDFQPPDANTHDYGVQLMTTVGAVESSKFPAPAPNPDPTPDPSGLPYGMPSLSSPVLVSVPAGPTDFFLPATTIGKDVICDYGGREGIVRQGGLIMDNSGGAPRKILHRNYHAKCTKPFDSSGYRSGGVRFQTQAQEAWVLDFYDEKHFTGATGIDGIGIASETYTKWYVQRCLLEGAPDSTAPGGQHIDCIQLQGPIGELNIGLCTMEMSGVRPGNDPGKALQLAEEPWQEDPETAFLVNLTKCDFECLGTVATGARFGVVMVQERTRDIINIGPEVYYQKDASLDPLGDNFAVTIYTYQRPGDYGTVSGTRPNRVLTAKAGSGVTGKIQERPSGSGHFVTRQMLGM